MLARHLVILNPAADRGAASLRVGEVRQALAAAGIRYELVLTERPMHAAELAAAAEGFDAVVAAGGDGTGNEVLNGLMAAGAAGRRVPALGILCVGRGNDLAYGAGVQAGVEEGCAILARGALRPMDVGQVSGPQLAASRYFGNGIGIGFDTIVTLEAGKFKWIHGFPGYVLGALKTLFLYYRAPSVALRWGGTSREQKSIQISAMIGKRMGGAFFMTPDSRNDDGELDLCIADGPRRLIMLGLILRYLRGTQAASGHITMARTSRLEVSALEGLLAVHADGEILGTGIRELAVECLPHQLQVITRVPE